VTIAYNKPATNPLQTAAGGQAVTIGAQPVINNVVATIPVYVSSVITSAAPTVLEMTYDQSLANIVPAGSVFDVKVNSLSRTVSSVSISGTKVLLTLATSCAYGNVVTIAYNKPATNPLQTAAGGQAASLSTQPVVNNCAPTLNQPPTIYITSPVNYSEFRAPATIIITAAAMDTDGTIARVEFFKGSTKLGEATTAPYYFSWNNVPRGRYTITAVATDNLNSTNVSNQVTVIVRNHIPLAKGDSEIRIIEPDNGKRFDASAKIDVDVFEDGGTEPINLYPNPNDGRFSIGLSVPLETGDNMVYVINSTGKTVYQGTWSIEEYSRQFDLNQLDSGIYILIIKGQSTLLTKKFIKR
jgi:uncharacterized repeat protein (TIGR02059 family)